MTTVAAERGTERAALNIAALFSVVILGAAAAISPTLAALWLAAIVTIAALYLRPALFVPLMIVSVYFGVVTVGGFTVARIIGPLSLPVAAVAVARQGGINLHGSSLPWFIAGYGTLTIASLLWTEDQPGTIGMLFSLALAVIYMVAIVALVRTRADLRLALRSFAFAAVALFLFGVAALATYGNPIDAQEVTGDRNFFAAFLSVGLGASIAMAAWPKEWWERSVALVIGALCILGVIVSQSQGGMLSTLSLLVVALLIVPRPAVRRRFAPLMVLCAPLLLVVVVLVLGSGGYSTASGGGLTSSIETSSIDRINLWRGAMNAYSENPATGVGFGAYAEHSAEWMLETPGVNLRLYNLPDHPQEAHNLYIEALSELGPLGLGLFLAMILSSIFTLGSMLRRARQRGDTEIECFAVGLLLGISALCVASFFLSIATNRAWWVIFGLVIASAGLLYEERRRSSGTERSAVIAREHLTR